MSDQQFEDTPADPSLADPLPGEPMALFARWLAEAERDHVQPNPQALTVASVGADGRPSARVVLCRGFDAEAGFVVFYSNRNSRKGAELAPHAPVAAVMHWDTLARQVRLEGRVVLSPEAESDAYFARRPRLAQISAWASEQSQPIASRAALLTRHAEFDQRWGISGDSPIARPPHWGGYRIWIERLELWVGSAGRCHDRGQWTRVLTPEGDGYRGGDWQVRRLQP